MDDDDRHVGLTHAEPVGQDGDDCQLAGPFLGNAITLIFRASPSQPTIWSRDDPGTTFAVMSAQGVELVAIATLRSRKCSV